MEVRKDKKQYKMTKKYRMGTVKSRIKRRKGTMSKLMSKEMKQYAESMIKALHKPTPNFDNYTYEMGNVLIISLKKEMEKQKEFFASKEQIERIKEMCNHPLIKRTLAEELGVVPFKWILAKEKLQEEVKLYNEILKTGKARKRLCKMGELEEVADFLFMNGITSEEENESLLWYKVKLETILERHDLIVIDGFIYELKIINKSNIESKINELTQRIATANQKIQEKIDNPYLFIEKAEATRFISAYSASYEKWKSERVTDKQLKYLLELHRRVNGTSENTEGYKLLSKKQASHLIKTLEAEQNQSYNINAEVEREFNTHKDDKDPQNNVVAWEEENNKEWANMLFTFNKWLGYKPEVEVGNIAMIKELMSLSEMLGNSKAQIDEHVALAYTWTVEELTELGIRLTDNITGEINSKKQNTLKEVQRLFDLGYITKEDLQAIAG